MTKNQPIKGRVVSATITSNIIMSRNNYCTKNVQLHRRLHI